MPTKITCGISNKDFAEAAKAVRKYQKDLLAKAKTLIKLLTNQCAVIARTIVVQMDAIDKGYLANSINAFYDPSSNIGFVRVDCDYAVFVEFGTGVRGVGSPYPGDAMSKVAYHYGDGTCYVMLTDGRVGWFYPADDGTMKFTEGMPSRPFMFETGQMLHRQVAQMAKEVFR